jgi:hypothetical protein
LKLLLATPPLMHRFQPMPIMMTTRGCTADDFSGSIASLLHECILIAADAQAANLPHSKKLKEFETMLNSNLFQKRINDVKNKVRDFASSKFYPGHDHL